MPGTAATVSPVLPSFPFTGPRPGPVEPPLSQARITGDAPVVRVSLPTGTPAWLVTRHADVREMLRSPAFSSDMRRPGFPLLRQFRSEDEEQQARERARAGMFIGMDPPEHTRFRRLLTPEFMIRGVQRLEPLIQETVDGFLDAMVAAGPPADLVAAYALPVPSLVICHLLGVPYADHDFFQARSRVLLDRTTPLDEVQRVSDDLRGYLRELIAVKEREGGDDVVARLVARLPAGELTRDEIVGVSLLLLIAGHETTSNMIGLSTLVLLEHPRQWAALAADPSAAPAVVEELLRYLTIARIGLARIAITDTEIGGQPIRAGDGVIALLSTANRDEAVFTGGDRFDVARGAVQHVAFGFGVHQCIGQPLARAELRIALSTLARRLPGLRLAVAPEEVPMREDAVVFGAAKLPVTW
jgi:cytochrome P450